MAASAPVVRLDADAASVILRAAESAYPNEACGVLVGSCDESGWHVTRAVAGTNVHPEPRHRFEVDPRLVFDWMRRLRGGSESLIGHFHSHPDGPAEPSATDRESAYDRNAIWLIAAVPGGRLGAVRAFRLGKGADPAFVDIPMAESPGGAGTDAGA
jgi:proteasome lid subunit RPN8/RPN11